MQDKMQVCEPDGRPVVSSSRSAVVRETGPWYQFASAVTPAGRSNAGAFSSYTSGSVRSATDRLDTWDV